MSLKLKQDHWQLLSWSTQTQTNNLRHCRESWETAGLSRQKKSSEWLTTNLPDRKEEDPSLGLTTLGVSLSLSLVVVTASRAVYLPSVVSKDHGKSLGSSLFTGKFVRIESCLRTLMTLQIASWYDWTSNMPCSHSTWRIRSTGIEQSSYLVKILS